MDMVPIWENRGRKEKRTDRIREKKTTKHKLYFTWLFFKYLKRTSARFRLRDGSCNGRPRVNRYDASAMS